MSKKSLAPSSLFNTNEAGMVELVLSPDELSTIMECLAFTQTVSNATLKKAEQIEDLTDKEREELVALQLKAYAASIVYERILVDTTGDTETPTPDALN